MPTYTVEIKRGDDPGEIFATYLRNGVKIALAMRHNNLMAEISLWVLDGKMPDNGTFYRY
jgi:hypothetical protein